MNKLVFSLCGLLIPVSLFAQAASPAESRPAVVKEGANSDLQEVQNLQLGELKAVTSVEISKDGKFLYAAAFKNSTVSVFKRDLETGQLEVLQTITNPDLGAAVSIRLSNDESHAVVSAFGAGTITLFERDASTGKLNLVAVARHQRGEAEGLDFVTDARLSHDNRFIYTAASNGVGVYRVEDAKLELVQMQSGDNRLRGVRAAIVSPDGGWVYAPAYQSGTIGVLQRNNDSGALQMGSVLVDGENGNEALAGAFRVACSSDGKHVYVSSGRFGRDQAISVYEVESPGNLKLIEAHNNGANGFEGFLGGNDIRISPDGQFVYALGSMSDRLVRFRRDPVSGKLSFLGSQPVGEHATPGSAGMCFSPDGRFVYVADEDANAIVVLKQP